MSQDPMAEKWARLRFAVVGHLLVKPPGYGELGPALVELATQSWTHPSTGEKTQFALSTIERWYYMAARSEDPIRTLRKKVRSDAGRGRILTAKLLTELEQQYRAHPSWSYQLHADNLQALVEEKPSLGPSPSYATLRRTMKRCGWHRRPRKRDTPGGRRALERLERREVRSYEVSHPHALWHLDGHQGSRSVLVGEHWHAPVCLCVLDDYSRLGCHAQWYLTEDAECVAHSFKQAMMKRRRPRSALSDNGGAMTAGEIENGLTGLSIVHDTTLPESPYQNGKQESFWCQIEGRLLPMVESVRPLTLPLLNLATQAWLEQEYNRSRHSELGESPLERMLAGTDVSRPCPSLDELNFHFTIKQTRRQRLSDGTVSIEGTRFEVPSKFRAMERVVVRYARWEPSRVYLVDPRDSDKSLGRLYPQDKRKNADSRRRTLEPTAPVTPLEPVEPVPPLLRKLLAEYAATGLPPAYIPHNSEQASEGQDNG